VFVGLTEASALALPDWMQTLLQLFVIVFIFIVLLASVICPILEFRRHYRLRSSQEAQHTMDDQRDESYLPRTRLLSAFLQQLRSTLNGGSVHVSAEDLNMKLKGDAAFREDAELALRSMFWHWLHQHKAMFQQVINSPPACLESTEGCQHKCLRHRMVAIELAKQLSSPTNMFTGCRTWLFPGIEPTIAPLPVAKQVANLFKIGLLAAHW
jgi:hypothetical protein